MKSKFSARSKHFRAIETVTQGTFFHEVDRRVASFFLCTPRGMVLCLGVYLQGKKDNRKRRLAAAVEILGRRP